jgi:hypothetical protein
MPATATSLTVPVTALTATDNVGVTGYLVNTSATKPLATAAGWTVTAPTSANAPAAGSVTFYAWAKDAAGNVSAAKSAVVTITLPDATLPVVGTFTMPATATSLTVPVTALTATDNVGVTGYLVNTSATKPLATAAGWNATAPTSANAPAAGSVTFYAWAKDAAGNVSAAKSAAVTITLPDATLPVVGTFTMPATATSLTVPVTALTAIDNVGVTGYLVNTSATKPLATAAGWTATAPTSANAPAAGSVTFYAWAKDAAGNVSAAKSAVVTITLPDATLPVVGTFTMPATATSLTVPVTALTATDNVGVTGYLVNTSATKPLATAAGWTATAPTSANAPAAGSVTFYAWAKDAAGNVSAAKSAVVTISASSTSFKLALSTLTSGSYTRNQTLNIYGMVSDPAGIKSLTVNGISVPVLPGGVFDTALLLQSGVNTIKVIATNNAGAQKSETRTITYASNLPEMSVYSPADNGRTIKSFINLTGEVDDHSRVTVKVNGGSAQNASINDEKYNATVSLVNGVNTIYINAIDLSGHVTSSKRTINYDNGKFSLAITSPAQDIATGRSYVTLKGSIADALSKVSVNITMDGKTYSPAVVNGVFQQLLNFTTAKLYTITVKATDQSGNSYSTIRNVIYRPGLPTSSDN